MALGDDKQQVEKVMYEHRCEICDKKWASIKKADMCPCCGHWHINFYGNSFLGNPNLK